MKNFKINQEYSNENQESFRLIRKGKFLTFSNKEGQILRLHPIEAHNYFLNSK